MADVFISHSSKDKKLADRICDELEERGISCRIAPRDITPGKEWAGEISASGLCCSACDIQQEFRGICSGAP